MVRSTPTQPEAKAISNDPSNLRSIQQEKSSRQTFKTAADLQYREAGISLWTAPESIITQPEAPDWTSTHTRKGIDSIAAAEGTLHHKAPVLRADGLEEESSERLSSSEMKTYALSHVYASSLCKCEQGQAHGPDDQHRCSLKHTELTRRRSSPGTQKSCHSSALTCRPSRRSICTSDREEPQHTTSETETGDLTFDVSDHLRHVATAERWCEEFHQTQVADWQQTASEYGQAWKQCCFTQIQAGAWYFNLIERNKLMEDIGKLSQSLDNFKFVLSLYSFLDGRRDRNLQPQLRRLHMTWRSREQIKLHDGCDLPDEKDGSLEETPGDDMSRDDDLGATTSKYPLTLHQHLCVARVCGYVAGRLASLCHWLRELRNRRVIYARSFSGPRTDMADLRWNLIEAERVCSSLARALTEQFISSRIHLCQALGLDHKKVPIGDLTANPSMTAMKYDKTPETPASSQGRSELSRRFRLKKASLEASRVFLKANLYVTLLPCKIGQSILEGMLVKSTEMAVVASEAGDQKAEAKMRRLHNKIRKVSERAGQEFPDMKPRMTLLDSETWPAVLNPRKDMEVKVHGHRSVPVETLIDMLHAPQIPIDVPEEGPDAACNHAPANFNTANLEHSPSKPAGEYHQPSSTSSPTMAVPEAGTDQV